MMSINKTIDFYNNNADEFIEGTYSVDMTKIQDVFLSYIIKGKDILDLGCGSGRDSKVFIDRGYNVTSVDGSIEICKRAAKFLNKEVINLKFEDINFKNKFDGIWACASLLHVQKSDLSNMFNKIIVALKENGVLYVSFKYGDFEGERNGRYFIDMNEDILRQFISRFKNIRIDNMWITGDVRNERQEEKWLNAIIIKDSLQKNI